MFLKVHQKCLQITENEMNIILLTNILCYLLIII